MGEGRAVCVFGSSLYQSRISPAVTNEEGRGGKNNTVKKKKRKKQKKKKGGGLCSVCCCPFSVSEKEATHTCVGRSWTGIWQL